MAEKASRMGRTEFEASFRCGDLRDQKLLEEVRQENRPGSPAMELKSLENQWNIDENQRNSLVF